jgi:hypothetical protein
LVNPPKVVWNHFEGSLSKRAEISKTLIKYWERNQNGYRAEDVVDVVGQIDRVTGK